MNLEQLLNEASARDSASRPGGSIKDVDGYQDFIDILTGSKKFEGEIDSPEKMQMILDKIKEYRDEKLDKQDPQYRFKNDLSKFYKKTGQIQDILDKIKKGDKITATEEARYESFADEVEDMFFKNTYQDKYLATSSGGSGGKANKIKFNESFPIRLINGDYYGIVNAPTGVITWQSDEARSAAADAGVPKKLPMSEKAGYKIMRSKEMDKQIGSVYEFDDSKEAKEATTKAHEDAGADQDKSVEKVRKQIGFWNDIKKIF